MEKWLKKIENADATPFQKKVWKAMLHIPKGKVATYAQVAARVGKPGAARAVGNACNANPFAPEVPCHRIVASNGLLGGYANGLDMKIKLLTHEKVKIVNGKIALENILTKW